MKLFAALAALTLITAPAAQAGFTKTVKVMTVNNTPEICFNLPTNTPVKARVLFTEMRVLSGVSTQKIILEAFC